MASQFVQSSPTRTSRSSEIQASKPFQPNTAAGHNVRGHTARLPLVELLLRRLHLRRKVLFRRRQLPFGVLGQDYEFMYPFVVCQERAFCNCHLALLRRNGVDP